MKMVVTKDEGAADHNDELQAVRARLVQALPRRPVLGLGLRSPHSPAPLPSLCPKPLRRLLRLPVPAGRLQRQDLPQVAFGQFQPPALPGLFLFFLHHLSHVVGPPERRELQEPSAPPLPLIPLSSRERPGETSCP